MASWWRSDLVGTKKNTFSIFRALLDGSGLSAARTFTLPDESMIMAGRHDLHATCQGRLTTESGVAISTSDRTAQSTIYFTLYNGNKVSLYDGTRWKLYTFTERSLALSGLTSDKNYDVFIYDNSGTITLELSSAWTNDTTRATALTTQDGIYVKSGSTTKRYLGTIRTTGTTTTEDSALRRFVWNLYNRTRKALARIEGAPAWTYATAAWRQANSQPANKVELVVGLEQAQIDVSVITVGYSDVLTPADVRISRDSITSEIGYPAVGGHLELNNSYMLTEAKLIEIVTIGYHYYSWLEYATGGQTVQFYGSSSLGITGSIDC